MDYRKFLGKRTEEVLPYFGGATVRAEGRRLRIRHPVPEGWWRFSVEGRFAMAEEPAEPPDLSARPRVRGHLFESWLFRSGKDVERVHLLPAEELLPLSNVTAVRWWDDTLLFASPEFDTEAEELARRALEEQRSVADIKGVAPSLRAAHGLALLANIAARESLNASPFEVRHELARIADHGVEAAMEVLRELERRRREEMEARRAAEHERRVSDLGVRLAREGSVGRRSRRTATRENAAERADAALEAAGADLLAARRLTDGQLEVAFRFCGERFVAVVDEISFQVYDAGICLSGADREVNLDSLPSVIREAIEDGVLVVTRR
jgi:hypothetical protein